MTDMQTPFNVTVQREVVVMVVVTAVVVEVVVVIQRIARVDYVHLPDEKEKEIYIYFINTCNKTKVLSIQGIIYFTFVPLDFLFSTFETSRRRTLDHLPHVKQLENHDASTRAARHTQSLTREVIVSALSH